MPSKIDEILEGLEGPEEVVVATPLRMRLIADAKIKTDKVDTPAFATRLPINLVAGPIETENDGRLPFDS